MPYRNESVMEN